MTHFTDKVAVVTGAGSGIGRALALALADHGAKLAISDVDAAGLARTHELLSARGARVRADRLDVADRGSMLDYADQVAAHFGVVHQVYNNAGIAFTGDIEAMDFAHLESVMNVDYWGVVHGTKAFLPHLIASGDGHIVNVSSVFGIIAVPTQSAYNAAKFAVRGFTEALRMEMQTRDRPVKVTCVQPGGIRTNVARNAAHVAGLDREELASSFDKIARTSPERAAQVIVKGVAKNRARVLIGADARAIDLLARVTGPRYQGVVRRFSGRMGL